MVHDHKGVQLFTELGIRIGIKLIYFMAGINDIEFIKVMLGKLYIIKTLGRKAFDITFSLLTNCSPEYGSQRKVTGVHATFAIFIDQIF